MAICSPILKGKTSPIDSKKVIVFFLSKRDQGRAIQLAVPGLEEAMLVSKWASKKPAERNNFCLKMFLYLNQVVSKFE